jgi:catechol 2,3-dioxygenase-like lactoylglutathione lyase family enzyme
MISGIHHVGLTVRDVEASAAWYESVLGFRRVGTFESPDGARRKVFLRHDGLTTRLGLTRHRHAGHDRFDETRTGRQPGFFGRHGARAPNTGDRLQRRGRRGTSGAVTSTWMGSCYRCVGAAG